ncbi:MAG: hypothetical protein KDA47_08260, partial [Planctomycetales bacterium]|nr:hypothetical protein [Planctomycetales bacterium]
MNSGPRFHAASRLATRIGKTLALSVVVAAFGFANPANAQPADAANDAKSTIVCEAESFTPSGSDGWRRGTFGENYYAATFANAFISRKAFLGAPEQCEETVATYDATITQPGNYLVLARYEAAYRFETQFRIVVEQAGQKKWNRLYGARKNLKIWAFREQLKDEVAWSWGAGENVVWEGHDARVALQPGRVTIKLIAAKQPEPAARRNVDLVMLTNDLEQVQTRIEKENYLPLDGMLTQQGDLYLKLHNQSQQPLKLTVPPGIEHSPYWVHMRSWKPLTVEASAGQTTDWIEVGSLLDTLSDGQWHLAAAGEALHYTIEFGVRDGNATRTIARFESRQPKLTLAYDADTRFSQRIRSQTDVLKDLVAYLKQHPAKGQHPRLTPIHATTFEAKPEDAEWEAARREFLKQIPIDPPSLDQPGTADRPRGYIDVRSYNDQRLETYLQELKSNGLADKIGVVSLGDEIGLPRPPAGDHEAFRDWLKRQGVSPADVVPAAGNDWSRVEYSADPQLKNSDPRRFYYSRRYEHAFGIQAMKRRTDLLRRYLPNAGIGANFSPHHGPMYLGEAHKWIDIFRQDGMTMPWSEDYIWQVPVGTQQMNFISLDMFRAAVVDRPKAKIHYYVMTHTPGQTTDNWRRQFFGDLAHGMQIVNLFEFRPVQAAYTENHCSDPAMYVAVRDAFRELQRFEDIVQAGRVRPGMAALLCGETGDIWGDNEAPFGAAKRAAYIAARHAQIPLDIVTEADLASPRMKNYRVLLLADRHVSRAASKAISDWVQSGGRLAASAGAGMWDEFGEPNKTLQAAFGIEHKALDLPANSQVTMIKQDLPFAISMDEVSVEEDGKRAVIGQVFGAKARFHVTDGTAETLASFKDGSPACVMRTIGQGVAGYAGFLPGFSYFQPAIPKLPVDRGATADSMCHLLPTDFNDKALEMFQATTLGIDLPVECSEHLVENTVIESPQGVAIPLVNWRAKSIEKLTITTRIKL